MSRAQRSGSARIVSLPTRGSTPDALRPVIRALREGRVVILPSETFYALCADASQASSVSRILMLKERPPAKGITVFIRTREDLRRLAVSVTPGAERLMDHLWPGPLTLVFEASSQVQPGLLAGGRTLGMRIPGHPLLRQILDEIRVPLTATSANRSGGPPPISAAQALESFGREDLLVVDGGITPGGEASTIVDVSRRPFRLLREGMVSYDAVVSAAGEEVLR